MSLLDTLAQSIAQMEGFSKSGSIAQRNNNPGNLRASSYAIGTDSNGYSIFASADDGWKALYHQLDLYAGRGMTLESMVNTYAPAADNNDPNNYLNFLIGKLGVGPSTSLNSLYDVSIPAGLPSSDTSSNADSTGAPSDGGLFSWNEILAQFDGTGPGPGSGGGVLGVGIGTIALVLGIGLLGYAYLS